MVVCLSTHSCEHLYLCDVCKKSFMVLCILKEDVFTQRGNVRFHASYV